MTSATSRSQIRARNKQIEADREVDHSVIVAMMGTPSGRRWIWRQLEFAQIFIVNENLDPYFMAFANGRRNTGVMLLSQVLAHSPDAFVRMLNENAPSLKSNPIEEADTSSDEEEPDA